MKIVLPFAKLLMRLFMWLGEIKGRVEVVEGIEKESDEREEKRKHEEDRIRKRYDRLRNGSG